jgi:hypothetical protein
LYLAYLVSRPDPHAEPTLVLLKTSPLSLITRFDSIELTFVSYQSIRSEVNKKIIKDLHLYIELIWLPKQVEDQRVVTKKYPSIDNKYVPFTRVWSTCSATTKFDPFQGSLISRRLCLMLVYASLYQMPIWVFKSLDSTNKKSSLLRGRHGTG